MPTWPRWCKANNLLSLSSLLPVTSSPCERNSVTVTRSIDVDDAFSSAMLVPVLLYVPGPTADSDAYQTLPKLSQALIGAGGDSED